ncbi:hypothetical protein GU249_08835 [Acinetobacter baumannii]|nr:hypothetical protein [Acinetobacter baumannii]
MSISGDALKPVSCLPELMTIAMMEARGVTTMTPTRLGWMYSPWAGAGYGARFLPRVGEIVVIDFDEGY